MERRLHRHYEAAADSDHYRVLDGAEELLPRMLEEGYLLGLVTPEQAVVVGDTPHDAAPAHAVGVPCVGVASHHYRAEQLRAGGADWVIDLLADGLPL